MKNIALIMAAGESTRCGFDKLLATIKNQTVLEKSVMTFQDCSLIDEIWIIGEPKTAVKADKLKGFIPGGQTRFESVSKAINHCQKHYKAPENIRIIVHNAANPYLSKIDLENGLKVAEEKTNLIFGFFTPNAIKQVSKSGIVSKFLDREQIFETQTPQIAPLANFIQALEIFRVRTQPSIPNTEFELKNTEPRDEAELLSLLNEPIYVYECDPQNTKITFPADLELSPHLRFGGGEDSHRFTPHFNPQKPFRLGGVDVSENRLSSDGNSDGDIILHSVCNALLSAWGEPTFDFIAAPICQSGETNSSAYLKATLGYLQQQGGPSNIKQVLISLEGAQPKIAPHHEAIVANLAHMLALKSPQIGLTYTSGEGLSDCGKGLGMRAHVLLTLADD